MLYFTRLLNVLLFSVISINSYCQKDKNVISNPNFTDILLIGYERVEELSKLGYRINSINISNELDNSFKVSKYKLKYHRMIPNQDSIFVETIIISNQKVNPFEKNFKDFFKLTEYAIDSKVKNYLELGPLLMSSYKNEKGFKVNHFSSSYAVNYNYNYQDYLIFEWSNVFTYAKILLKNEIENKIEIVDNFNPNRLKIINENYDFICFSILYQNNYRLIND